MKTLHMQGHNCLDSMALQRDVTKELAKTPSICIAGYLLRSDGRRSSSKQGSLVMVKQSIAEVEKSAFWQQDSSFYPTE